MTERLRGLSILIVEDEYFIAMQVANAIESLWRLGRRAGCRS